MKKINKASILSLVILSSIATDCKSSGTGHADPFLITTFGPTYTSTIDPTENTKQKSQRDKEEKQLLDFVRTNWSNLTIDMTKGSGSYLETLAHLLKLDYEDYRLAFYLMCKDKFKELIPSPQTTPEQFIVRVKDEGEALKYESSRYSTIVYVTKNWAEVKKVLANLPDKFNFIENDLLHRFLYSDYAVYEKDFHVLLKTQYKNLIPSDKTTPEQFVRNLESAVTKLKAKNKK